MNFLKSCDIKQVLYCKLSQFQKIPEITAGHLSLGLELSTKVLNPSLCLSPSKICENLNFSTYSSMKKKDRGSRIISTLKTCSDGFLGRFGM